MFEGLIQKLINRKVGAIAGNLIPTGGWTACPIETGSFSYTYDGNTSTICYFGEVGSCLCEWYWDTPVTVTKFNIFTLNYNLNSDIYRIWGRVNGSWVELWSGTWIPSNNVWSSKSISCNNCDGIRIGQHLGSQDAAACITEVSVDYEEAPPPECSPEGARETLEYCWDGSIKRERVCENGQWKEYTYTCPDEPPIEETLTEAVTCKWVTGFQDHGAEVTQFAINETVYAYAEIALHGNDAYGKIMKHEWWYKETGASEFTKKWEWESDPCSSHYTNNWATWTWWAIGLTHGAGTGYIKIFFDGVYMGKTNDYTIIDYPEGKSTITGVTKPNTFMPNVSFEIDTTIRNDGGDDYLFGKLIDTDTGATLDEYTTLNKIYADHSWVYDVILTLVQNTDFHGRIDAGHEE